VQTRAKYIPKNSTHPKIKGGEFYKVYFRFIFHKEFFRCFLSLWKKAYFARWYHCIPLL